MHRNSTRHAIGGRGLFAAHGWAEDVEHQVPAFVAACVCVCVCVCVRVCVCAFVSACSGVMDQKHSEKKRTQEFEEKNKT